MKKHREGHFLHRVGWLRAAVLGANDGIVSTASLLMGVAAAQPDTKSVLIAGVAGLVAGAMSMAAGEYVSVSSQSDTEHADIEREKAELAADPVHELAEMTGIYVGRGLQPELAEEVARQLMAHDALAAHARDELGISEISQARPMQAALASAASFSVGALLPVLVAAFAPAEWMMAAIAATSLCTLALLGAMSARAGGASIPAATLRVTFWGAAAMCITSVIGKIFGIAV
mgnify:CR=1 FL=1